MIAKHSPFVIPGRPEGPDPESILRSAANYGFRVRRFAAPRNDSGEVGPS